MIAYPLPDLYRYAKTELSPRKLALTAAFVAIIGACLVLLAVNSLDADRWTSLGNRVYWLQALALLTFGAARTGASVSGERAGRTWDFQRLTPLSSWQSAWGRLIGAPLLAFAIVVFLAPFGFGGALVGGFLPSWLVREGYLLCIGFAGISMGLFVSAHVEDGASRGANWAAPVLGLLTALILGQGPSLIESTEHGVTPMGESLSSLATFVFYGQEVSSIAFASLSALAFGAWFFAFAAWRIGHDYLERRQVWASPAFTLFVLAYAFGFPHAFENQRPTFIALAALLPAYAAALWTPNGEDPYLEWMGRFRAQGFAAAARWLPSWLLTWWTVFVAALVLQVWRPEAGLLSPLLLAKRDLCLIQAVRLTRAKRPELLAAILLGVLYFASGALSLVGLERVWLIPIPGKENASALVPALVHAIVGAGILLTMAWRRARPHGRESAPTSA